jgi:hypothetical protein
MLREFGASHLNNSAGSSLLSRIPNHAWQGRAHTLLPEPPKDGTFADSGRLQPVLKRQGGSIEHRLARSRGRGDAGLLGLAVLEAVSARVMTVVLRGRSPCLTAARAARLSTVRTAGCSQGLGCRLSRCAVDRDPMADCEARPRSTDPAWLSGRQPPTRNRLLAAIPRPRCLPRQRMQIVTN